MAPGAGNGMAAGDEGGERRGLGRGLAEIFENLGRPPVASAAEPAPGLAGGPPRAVSSVDEVARAGLAAAHAVLDLDLCAYLHVAESAGPRLFLRSPTLESLAPTEAFQLLTALKRLLDARADGPATIGPYAGVAVASRGEWSQGLHAGGRAERPLGATEAAALTRMFAALGGAAHAAEAAINTVPARPVRVLVDVGVDEARADVWLPAPGPERRGSARARTPLLAVAAATVAATGAHHLELVHVAERFVGGVAITVAILRADDGRDVVGAVARGDDSMHAAAAAALEALRQAPATTDGDPSGSAPFRPAG
jgi:hypothetical protein